ncbi:MAG: hypothetical protein NTW86_31545 [Candidatus Sumerlaeota bacterium]|nr:hypothetical protein [Candidatus Sumerlaeota bacterium]
MKRAFSPPLRRAPFHPVFFSAFPVVSLFAHNQQEVNLYDLWHPLGLALLAGAAVWGIALLWLRAAQKAALVASLFMTILFLWGHAYSLTQDWYLFGMYLGTPRILFVTMCVAFTVGLYFCANAGRSLPHWTAGLNLVGAFLLLMPLASIGHYQIDRAIALRQRVRKPASEIVVDPAKALPRPPDIYYIILDGYARHDVLKNLAHYDNSEFLDFLRRRGFYVADRSRSNYGQTYLSLCSSMNLTLLDALAERVGRSSSLKAPIIEMLHDNLVMRFLHQRGYTTMCFETGFEATEMDEADVRLRSSRPPNEFDHLILGATPLPIVFHDQLERLPFHQHRAHVLSVLERLGNLSDKPSPKFVFAHVIAPHPPFVFGANGEPVQPDWPFGLWDYGTYPSREEYLTEYAAQARFITKKVMETIEGILTHSAEPPVILLQGDHGPASKFDGESLARTDAVERFSILNAYLMSKDGEAKLYPDISPVNSFRAVFDCCFGTNLDLRPDRSYYCTLSHPYEYTDITERVVAGDSETTSTLKSAHRPRHGRRGTGPVPFRRR